MHIKQNVDLVKFLKQVRMCQDEVFFETKEGDSLALRSELCQYIFCTLANKPEILYNGTIRFVKEEDLEVIREFLEI